jgi:hypothetical protein
MGLPSDPMCFALIKDIVSDAPFYAQKSFQDTATEFLESMIDLHHDVFGYLVIISFFVSYILGQTIYLF